MIKIKMNTQNAAFDDDNYGAEVARILRRLADSFERDRNPVSSLDIDGNLVCTVEYTGKDR